MRKMNGQLLSLMQTARIYDLAQPYYVGMPHFPTHSPYLFGLNKKHGDMVTPIGASSVAETITLGSHCGTHMDALSHFTCDGKLHGGLEPVQSYDAGVEPYAIETIPPIVRRGVLLDVAGFLGDDVLSADFAITPEHLDAILARHSISIQPGDVVLLRTGWARFWADQKRFVTGGGGVQATGPGPEEPAAKWLSGRGVFAAGSDTLAFERVPSAMPVHVHLLVHSGIHIIECLNLEELAGAGVREFLFVAAPLKFRGASGSPIRPFAVA